MTAVKEADVSATVEAVMKTHGQTGVDNLMKYVCRGLAEAESCNQLLKFHTVIVDSSGLGPIVRTMTDRRTA